MMLVLNLWWSKGRKRRGTRDQIMQYVGTLERRGGYRYRLAKALGFHDPWDQRASSAASVAVACGCLAI